jgi:hypothetical protein
MREAWLGWPRSLGSAARLVFLRFVFFFLASLQLLLSARQHAPRRCHARRAQASKGPSVQATRSAQLYTCISVFALPSNWPGDCLLLAAGSGAVWILTFFFFGLLIFSSHRTFPHIQTFNFFVTSFQFFQTYNLGWVWN